MPFGPHSRSDLTRNTLGVLAIAVLAGACFWIARPFLVPLMWASMIVIATWPALKRMQALLWGNRKLAAAVLTLTLVLVFVIPILLTAGTIVSSADQIVEWSRSLIAGGLPHVPSFVADIPFIGPKISRVWEETASSGPGGLAARLAPYAGRLTLWFVHSAGGAGRVALDIFLTVVLAAVLYATGDRAAAGVLLFVRRLAGPRGERAVLLAAASVRGVALGVVVTALVQTLLAGIGMAVCGVPAAGILTAVTFVVCIAQIGPGIVLFSASGWLFWSGATVWGVVLAVWALIVVLLDNFLRPYLIKLGADLPLLLIFAGVIGGMIAFGIVGIFIGPAVLAVTQTLLTDWVIHQGEEEAAADPA